MTMNTTTKNNYIAMATVSLSVAVSTALTTIFMYGLGSNKLIAALMAATGVCLELGKVMFSRHIAESSGWKSFFSILCTALLMSISILASYAALETASIQEKSNSTSYIELTRQIDSKRNLSQLQADANQITKSANTLNEIDLLIKKRESLPSESLMAKHGPIISIIAAIALEMVSCASVAICTLERSEHRTCQNETEQTGTKLPLKPVVATIEQREPEQKQLIFQAKTDITEQIRNAVLTRSIERPSVACIRESFSGIASEKISQILKDLGETGFLIKNGRGWTYA